MMIKILRTIPLLLLLLVALPLGLRAQVQAHPVFERSAAFEGEEHLHYSVYFRWGIIKGKAGDAVISISPMHHKGQWLQQLHFRTKGIFESVFPMRDTLETVYGANKMPHRWAKRCNEGGYYLIDELDYSYSSQRTTVKSMRRTLSEVKVDTTLVISRSQPAVDMLAAFAFMRGLDHTKLVPGYREYFVVPIGHDLVRCEIAYAAKERMSIPDGVEVEAVRYALRIADSAFAKSNNAVQLWVSNDDRRIPLKIKAKLTLGYAECSLTRIVKR